MTVVLRIELSHPSNLHRQVTIEMKKRGNAQLLFSKLRTAFIFTGYRKQDRITYKVRAPPDAIADVSIVTTNLEGSLGLLKGLAARSVKFYFGIPLFLQVWNLELLKSYSWNLELILEFPCFRLAIGCSFRQADQQNNTNI